MTISAGTRLGPYEILEPLGAGGMGEVYRARDPRLSREVAVKLITTDGAPSPDRLRRFETEARAAAQLSHPNVVTVHDVGTHEGHPYLVLELLEGETLREALRGGVPPLRQSVVWALEVSRGLAAAHERGIVHRDLKPENVFLTTDGRVKILDFGLAKLREPLVSDEADRESPTATKDTSPGVLLGTVGYMSPEQVKGQTPDPRTDVFALGTVLFEMVTGRRAFGGETAPEVLASILRDEPPALESIQSGIPAPLETVVRRCLAKRPADRFSSGRALEAALETVLPSLEPSRVSGARLLEPRGPYPGLSSFTEADAERFFGREAEVEALWTKLRRGRLLAVIGPSGAGKTSFVRAGLVPSRPSRWGAIVMTPGASPMRGLAEALVGEMPSDPDTIRELLRFDDPDVAFRAVRRWRDSHLEALLVVDQFEELFTLSSEETQARVSALLGRISAEADVRVLLSMRDDFLIRCHQQKPLEPVFLNLTPLLALEGEDLHRALTKPAEREGFAFGDDALVAEMLESVEGARGALPLLAFAVSRLWEKRDREAKLLTRRAYEEIGGVAGALAQHAEQTLERIGLDKEPVVRELFRNLVTAQWTRAVGDREQLLSVLPDREVGGQVLDHLVDARLLTSYEVREGGDEEGSRQRIEIVHESLLRAWPRLVRWQAQDEEGAVLRDQLKQVAHLWEEKGRPDDLLWTGTSEREFELWQDRYPGKLTALEDGFAKAMVQRAQRRRRLRKLVTASVVVGLAGVAGAIAVSRQQAVEQARRAEAEALRAEAGKLVALARNEVDRYPTAALAYARKSLELADTHEGRRLAVEILWRGPVARILPVDRIAEELGIPAGVYFKAIVLSPDDRWVAAGSEGGHVLLFPVDGGVPRALPAPSGGAVSSMLGFSPDGEELLTGGPGQSLRFISVPDLDEIRRVELGGLSWGRAVSGPLVTETTTSELDPRPLIRAWASDEPLVVGRRDWDSGWHLDVAGRRLAYGRGRNLIVRSLEGFSPSRERIVGRLNADVADVGLVGGDDVVSLDAAGEVRLWSVESSSSRVLSPADGAPFGLLAVGPRERRVAVSRPQGAVEVCNLDDPPDSAPLRLERPEPFFGMVATFDGSDRWLVTNNHHTVAFWPLAGPWRRTLRYEGDLTMVPVCFSPDGRWLASVSLLGREGLRLWPLDARDGVGRSLREGQPSAEIGFHPDGRRALVSTHGGGAFLVSLGDGSERRLETGWEGKVQFAASPTVDSSGRRGAVAPYNMNPSIRDPELRALRMWDLDSGEGRTYSLAHLTNDSWWGFDVLRFLPDGSLLGAGQGADGVVHLSLPSESTGAVSSETLYPAGGARLDLSADGRRALVWASRSAGAFRAEELAVLDLSDGSHRRIETHGQDLWSGAIDAAGKIIATGDTAGVVRVGPATGEEPHLLLGGHSGTVWSLDISPDGRWVASVGDEAIHLWPMPDVTKPPLHTLPYEELMAKLDALTNLRVVRDSSSSTGWTLDVGPFPGWEDVPSW